MNNLDRLVRLELSRFDRDLIRQHGYPFPEVEDAINAVPASVDVAVVSCDAYWVEQLLGNLAISINDCTDNELQDDLDELYESIQAQSSYTYP